LRTQATELTTLAQGVAELNERIAVYANVDVGQLPNDLFDKRDYLIQQISEIAGVSVVNNSDRTINLFLGNGQGLVVGPDAGVVATRSGLSDATRDDLIFTTAGRTQIVTNDVSGGTIGGLFEFRNEVLDPIYNQLGLLAISISDLVNDQHALGMDLDNHLGQDFFRDVNDASWMALRSYPDSNNALPDDRVLTLEITDVSEMFPEDYELSFSDSVSGQYTVTRISDDVVVATSTFSGLFPADVEFEGLTLTLVSGSFQGGDSFTLNPFRQGAKEMTLEVSNVRNLAFAQPVRIQSSSTNQGTGAITAGEVLDTSTSYFGTSEELTPPLLIQFISSTRYEILDNTDSTTPIQLVPPLTNIPFVPGVDNIMLPLDNNQTGVTSDGAAIGQVQRHVSENGYADWDVSLQETVEFITVDPDTRIISTQNYVVNAHDSAADIATGLDGIVGLTATSRNEVVLSNFSNGTGTFGVTLNGQILIGDNPDTITDSINSNVILAGFGITALSDGSEITISADTGLDFNVALAGALATDSVVVTGLGGTGLTLTGIDAVPFATVGGTIDLILEEGISINGAQDVFSNIPTLTSRFMGMQTVVTGQPTGGDRFTLDYNTDGFSDNRNVLKLAQMQSLKMLAGDEATLRDTFANIVDQVGTFTMQYAISRESALTLFERAESDRQSTSGVSLDEEAANLIKFELQYNAAAQLISVARGLIDTLLRAVG